MRAFLLFVFVAVVMLAPLLLLQTVVTPQLTSLHDFYSNTDQLSAQVTQARLK